MILDHAQFPSRNVSLAQPGWNGEALLRPNGLVRAKYPSWLVHFQHIEMRMSGHFCGDRYYLRMKSKLLHTKKNNGPSPLCGSIHATHSLARARAHHSPAESLSLVQGDSFGQHMQTRRYAGIFLFPASSSISLIAHRDRNTCQQRIPRRILISLCAEPAALIDWKAQVPG